MPSNLTQAVRQLRGAPGFTLTALLSITLSVGIASIVFAAVKAVLLNPLPYAQPEELVQVATDFAGARQSEGDWVFYNDANALIARNTTLASAGLYTNAVFDLAGNPPEALYGVRVSASLFPTLGVTPMLGRNIRPDEEHVLVLSHGLWTRRFASDPSVIGRALQINSESYTVIGVMRPEFNFPIFRSATRAPAPYVQFWAPMAIDPAKPPQGAMSLIARLKPGVTLPQARADLQAISQALRREFPATNRDRTHRLGFYRDRLLRNTEAPLWLLMGMASLFLLLGCANVANLLLARSVARQREFAIRTALGATPGRLLRQLLTESTLLAVMGGFAGFALAHVTWQILPALVPMSIPRLAGAQADLRVFLFAIAAAILPALSALQPSQLDTLRARSGHQGLRGVFVTAGIAITVMLVIVGAQLGHRFLQLLRTDPGFDADHTFASVILPAQERYPTPGQRAAIYRRFLESARTLPVVEAAGVVNALPFSGENHGGWLHIGGQPVLAEVNVVGGDYLQAMGLKLRAGRWFRDEEPNSVIIDESLAQRLWPDWDAVGQEVCVHCTEERNDGWKQVIGVVSSSRHASLEGAMHHSAYLAADALAQAAFLVVRTNRPPDEMDKAIRAAVASIDPSQPVLLSASLRALVSDTIADRRFILAILAVTAGFALLLALAGVYGLAAYATKRRTQEIGIRVALGATPASIRRLFLRQGFTMVLTGLCAGGLIAFVTLRLLRSAIPGFESVEPAVPVAATLLVLFTATVACWIPAEQASGADPLTALRRD